MGVAGEAECEWIMRHIGLAVFVARTVSPLAGLINTYRQTEWLGLEITTDKCILSQARRPRLRFQCRRSRFAILLNRPLLPRYLLLALSDFPVFEYSRQSVHWLTRAVKNNDESVSSTRLVSPQFCNAGFSSVDWDNVFIMVERNKIDWNNLRTKRVETVGLTRWLEIHAALYTMS